MPNISEESLRLLNNQIKEEIYNSQFYRYIGSYLKKLGLDNIGSYFGDTQVEEEQSHSQMITDYINNRNEEVIVLSVPDVSIDIQNLTQLAELYLQREQITTAKLSTIASNALAEGDFMLFDFMQGMVKIQRDEEKDALNYLDRARMADNDLKTYLIWDANFKI
jgi:ferritin